MARPPNYGQALKRMIQRFRAKGNREFLFTERPTHASYTRYIRTHPKTAVFSKDPDYSDTPNVNVFVMLPLGIINMECELVDPDGQLLSQLKTLKSVNVYGVTVEVWWGIVESNDPQEYHWEGYKQLFRIVRDLGLKIQVEMSFHEFRGDDDVYIPLPKWVRDIGEGNPDIYFTDRCGKQNRECLTWGIDDVPVLRGRTALQVYSDFMCSFRDEFDEFFQDRSMARIQIGLGAHGELRYPSSPVNDGTGEFQCYDKYLREALKEAAEARGGDSSWCRPPDNALDTNSFSDYSSSEPGKFFLEWYSQYLIDHCDRVLTKANLAFKRPGYASVKLSGMNWWYKTASHATAELMAGFGYGYTPVASMLKTHYAALHFTYVEQNTLGLKDMVDPYGLVWKVLNTAWDLRLPVAGENELPCYDVQGYKKILELAKPRNVHESCRHLSAFTYHRLNQTLLEQHKLEEFRLFVQKMNGDEPEPRRSNRLKLRTKKLANYIQ